MDYSKVMDQMHQMMTPRRKEIRLPMPLPDCKIGELYEGDLTFRVVAQDMNGATIEILNFEVEDPGKPDEPGRSSMPMIVPAPS